MIPTIHKKIHFYEKGERLKGSGQLQQNTEIMHVKVVFHAILTIFNFFSRVLSKFEIQAIQTALLAVYEVLKLGVL